MIGGEKFSGTLRKDKSWKKALPTDKRDMPNLCFKRIQNSPLGDAPTSCKRCFWQLPSIVPPPNEDPLELV